MSEEQTEIDELNQTRSSNSISSKKAVKMGPKDISIPSSWVLSLCGDLYDPVNGRSFSKNEWSEQGTPIIRIQDLRKDADSEVNYFDGEVDEKYHVQDGDLLFSWAGNIKTSLGAYIWEGDEGYLNQHIYNLNRISTVNDLFTKYSLNHYLPVLKTMVSGSAGQVHITKTNFNRFEIPTPPISEQRKIATVLYTVDQAVEKTEQIVNRMNRLRKGLHQTLFRDWSEDTNTDSLAGRYPHDWELKTLSDVVTITDAEHFTPDYVECGIPVLRPGDLTPGQISLEDVEKRVDEETYEDLTSRHIPSNEDIVYSRSQNFAVASQVIEDEPFCLGQDMVVIESEVLNETFLLHLLNSPVVRNQAVRRSTGSTFSRVNLGDIRSYKVPIPSKDVQQEIAEIISQWEKNIRIEQDTLGQLKRLKRGLMQDLLSGTVRTTDTTIPVPEGIAQYG